MVHPSNETFAGLAPALRSTTRSSFSPSASPPPELQRRWYLPYTLEVSYGWCCLPSGRFSKSEAVSLFPASCLTVSSFSLVPVYPRRLCRLRSRFCFLSPVGVPFRAPSFSFPSFPFCSEEEGPAPIGLGSFHSSRFAPFWISFQGFGFIPPSS